MNVLHLLYGGNIGGIEKQCLNLALEKDTNDINHFIFVNSKGPIYEEMELNGCSVKCLQLNNKDTIKCAKALRKIIVEKKIDIVVIQHFAPLICCAVVLLKKMYPKIRYLLYAHSCYDSIIKKSFLKREIFRITAKHADALVAISNFVKNSILLNEKRIQSDKIRVVYNGTACNQKERVKEIDWKKPIRLIYVGRLIEEKGVQLLINAVISSQYSKRFICNIVGDGPYRAELEKISAGHSNIVFHGARKNVEEYLDDADIFIHSALCLEGFGISIIEAMSRGLLCIAFPKGAIPEIITNKKDGYLVQGDTEKALQIFLEDLLIKRPKDEISKIRYNAINRSKDFSMKIYADNLHNLYTDLIMEEK